MAEVEQWRVRLYDEIEPQRRETIFGELQRLATNRAVFLSLHRMLVQSDIDPGALFWDFVTDGYRCDQVVSLRRLTESNLSNGKLKQIDKQVNSLMGLAECLQETEVIKKLKLIADKLTHVANKVFAHNDLKTADEQRHLALPTHDDLDRFLKELHCAAIDLGTRIGVDVPDKLVPANQFDWSQSFSVPWRPDEFDDSDIWDDL